MNLPFSRIIKGKHTYFPEKIIAGLDLPDWQKSDLNILMAEVVQPSDDEVDKGSCKPHFPHKPKLHTLRENPKGTWKPGIMAQPMFWTGRPYWSSPFYFAPKFPIISTQQVEIKYVFSGITEINGMRSIFIPEVIIDGKTLSRSDMMRLAINDGFNSLDEFFAWFNKSKDYTLIHWTNLKY